ncbi:MAG: hypothetical protein K0S29_228 [Gammaproteobacteria bacterium]|nr:hypothetical protein [Gammaproteobacteria bacterium]
MAGIKIAIDSLDAVLTQYAANQSIFSSMAQALCCKKDPFIRELEDLVERCNSNSIHPDQSVMFITLTEEQNLDFLKLLLSAESTVSGPAKVAHKQLISLYSEKHWALFKEFADQTDDVFKAIMQDNHDLISKTRALIAEAQRQAQEEKAAQAQLAAAFIRFRQGSDGMPSEAAHSLLTEAATGKDKAYGNDR